MAIELKALGVNLCFGPVVDIDSNPDNPVIGPRAFGRDPATVIASGRAFRDAQSEGELVTRKDLQIELAPIRADLNLLKWMMGALIALAIANFAKQFF